jgi:hypothetical protein
MFPGKEVFFVFLFAIRLDDAVQAFVMKQWVFLRFSFWSCTLQHQAQRHE